VILKGIERTVKRGAFAVASALAGGAAGGRPDWRSRTHRVLLLRYDRIGDMLIATPIIRAIASSYPSIELDVLASPSNHAVLLGNPNVRRVHVFDRRSAASFVNTVQTLRAERYDAVISGMLKPSATSTGLMLGAGARYRIGIAKPADAHAYNIPVTPAPSGQSFARQLGETLRVFGVDPDTTDWHYDLFLTDAERGDAEARWGQHPGTPRVLVNVSAFTPDRRWPGDRYVALIRRVKEKLPDASILVVGDPRDWSAAGAVAAASGVTGVDVSPIRNAFAFVAASDLLITPDTSLAHAASAEGIPGLVLFRSGAEMFAPPGNLVRVVSRGALHELMVDEVMPSLDQLLARW
jgi:ADP-heptose:LPS heptosyltransferase